MTVSPASTTDERRDFRDEPSRTATALRAGVALAVVIVAYHHSLAALLGSVSADTPFAYVAFVPVLALLLAVGKAGARAGEPRLPDRQVDWIIGVPLLLLALMVAVVLPERLSYSYWTNRIDLLGLPLFVAGVVALLFGSRVLYRIRLPIAFLLLAWPFPYDHLMGKVLSFSTSVALWGVAKGLPIVGGAHLVADSVYRIGAGSRQFTVNVAPTCAGASSAIGFLLVGGAAVLLLDGRRIRKLGWLAFGVGLMMLLNVFRVLLLFWAGDRYGQDLMMGSLHPYAGLVLFLIGCLAAMKLLPRFGIGAGTFSAARLPAHRTAPISPGGFARAVAGARTSLVLVVALSVWLAGQNAQLARFDPFGPTTKAATTTSVLAEPAVVPGWTGTRYEEVPWSKQYFGRSSLWWRYVYQSPAPPTGIPFRSMFVDVVNVADVAKFSTYGIEACYRFHGYRIVASRRTDVGTAAPAQTITYLDTHGGKMWSVVSWVSPVRSGSGRRFERIVLLVSLDAGGNWRSQAAAATTGLVYFARSFAAEQATHTTRPGVAAQ